jgi:hypothetical protein
MLVCRMSIEVTVTYYKEEKVLQTTNMCKYAIPCNCFIHGSSMGNLVASQQNAFPLGLLRLYAFIAFFSKSNLTATS